MCLNLFPSSILWLNFQIIIEFRRLQIVQFFRLCCYRANCFINWCSETMKFQSSSNLFTISLNNFRTVLVSISFQQFKILMVFVLDLLVVFWENLIVEPIFWTLRKADVKVKCQNHCI